MALRSPAPPPAATTRAAARSPAARSTAVNETERDGENGATYEVEVAKPDGSQVDVRLDDQFKVVVIEADGEKN